MSRTKAKPEIEYVKTSKEAKAAGLRRIKRRHLTKNDKEKSCQVITEISLDADLFKYLESEANKLKNSNIEKLLNEIIREKFEKEEARKLAEVKELRSKLLNDSEFLEELKEKLAA